MSYRIAIGTVDGVMVTEHFGHGKEFLVVEIDQQTEEVKRLGSIEVKASESCSMGHDDDLIRQKIQALLDWKVAAILVKQIGPKSERMVTKNGIEVLVTGGKVEEALERIKSFYKRRSFL
jgi:predicted Fe-Mo cluster-binding NifX family protein